MSWKTTFLFVIFTISFVSATNEGSYTNEANTQKESGYFTTAYDINTSTSNKEQVTNFVKNSENGTSTTHEAESLEFNKNQQLLEHQHNDSKTKGQSETKKNNFNHSDHKQDGMINDMSSTESIQAKTTSEVLVTSDIKHINGTKNHEISHSDHSTTNSGDSFQTETPSTVLVTSDRTGQSETTFTYRTTEERNVNEKDTHKSTDFTTLQDNLKTSSADFWRGIQQSVTPTSIVPTSLLRISELSRAATLAEQKQTTTDFDFVTSVPAYQDKSTTSKSLPTSPNSGSSNLIITDKNKSTASKSLPTSQISGSTNLITTDSVINGTKASGSTEMQKTQGSEKIRQMGAKAFNKSKDGDSILHAQTHNIGISKTLPVSSTEAKPTTTATLPSLEQIQETSTNKQEKSTVLLERSTHNQNSSTPVNNSTKKLKNLTEKSLHTKKLESSTQATESSTLPQKSSTQVLEMSSIHLGGSTQTSENVPLLQKSSTNVWKRSTLSTPRTKSFSKTLVSSTKAQTGSKQYSDSSVNVESSTYKTEQSSTAGTKVKTPEYSATIWITSTGTEAVRGQIRLQQSDDTYWPLILAVAVGVPTIIVIGVTITVIHNRRFARPSRSRFLRSRFA